MKKLWVTFIAFSAMLFGASIFANTMMAKSLHVKDDGDIFISNKMNATLLVFADGQYADNCNIEEQSVPAGSELVTFNFKKESQGKAYCSLYLIANGKYARVNVVWYQESSGSYIGLETPKDGITVENTQTEKRLVVNSLG